VLHHCGFLGFSTRYLAHAVSPLFKTLLEVHGLRCARCCTHHAHGVKSLIPLDLDGIPSLVPEQAQINDMQISEIGIVSGGWDNTWHSTPWCHGHGSPNWADTSCTCDEGYGGDRCDEWYHRQATGHTKSAKPKHVR